MDHIRHTTAAVPPPSPEGIALGEAGRPDRFVAAAIADRATFEETFAELVAAGVAPDTVAVLQGHRGITAIAHARRSGRRLFDLSDAGRYVERFEDEVRNGHYVIGVPLSRGAEALHGEVRRILAGHGHAVVDGTRWSYETVN